MTSASLRLNNYLKIILVDYIFICDLMTVVTSTSPEWHRGNGKGKDSLAACPAMNFH